MQNEEINELKKQVQTLTRIVGLVCCLLIGGGIIAATSMQTAIPDQMTLNLNLILEQEKCHSHSLGRIERNYNIPYKHDINYSYR